MICSDSWHQFPTQHVRGGKVYLTHWSVHTFNLLNTIHSCAHTNLSESSCMQHFGAPVGIVVAAAASADQIASLIASFVVQIVAPEFACPGPIFAVSAQHSTQPHSTQHIQFSPQHTVGSDFGNRDSSSAAIAGSPLHESDTRASIQHTFCC